MTASGAQSTTSARHPEPAAGLRAIARLTATSAMLEPATNRLKPASCPISQARLCAMTTSIAQSAITAFTGNAFPAERVIAAAVMSAMKRRINVWPMEARAALTAQGKDLLIRHLFRILPAVPEHGHLPGLPMARIFAPAVGIFVRIIQM